MLKVRTAAVNFCAVNQGKGNTNWVDSESDPSSCHWRRRRCAVSQILPWILSQSGLQHHESLEISPGHPFSHQAAQINTSGSKTTNEGVIWCHTMNQVEIYIGSTYLYVGYIRASLLGLVIYKLLRISQLMQRGDDIWVDSHYLSKGHTEELAWQQPFLYNNITVTGNACCFPALNF